MKQHKLRRKVVILIALIVLAFIYTGWFAAQNTITGTARWDGVTGVMFGLYICSQPAANFLDLILFRSLVFPNPPAHSVLASWLGFNLFVLLVGWLVIFEGMLRFSKP
jgi:hypothetical protein